jgi:hypothetical protein
MQKSSVKRFLANLSLTRNSILLYCSKVRVIVIGVIKIKLLCLLLWAASLYAVWDGSHIMVLTDVVF